MQYRNAYPNAYCGMFVYSIINGATLLLLGGGDDNATVQMVYRYATISGTSMSINSTGNAIYVSSSDVAHGFHNKEYAVIRSIYAAI